MSVVVTRGRIAAVLAVAGLSLALAACQSGPVGSQMQARADARGTAQPIPRMEDWGFGMRSTTPGYLFDRSGGA
jgi:hypothetical protein